MVLDYTLKVAHGVSKREEREPDFLSDLITKPNKVIIGILPNAGLDLVCKMGLIMRLLRVV